MKLVTDSGYVLLDLHAKVGCIGNLLILGLMVLVAYSWFGFGRSVGRRECGCNKPPAAGARP